MHAALKEQGGELWAISTEPPELFKAERKKTPDLPCLLGSDASAEALRSLHLVHEFAGKTMAIPANILIGKDGVVRWTHYAKIASDRPSPGRVLDEVRKLAPAAPVGKESKSSE